MIENVDELGDFMIKVQTIKDLSKLKRFLQVINEKSETRNDKTLFATLNGMLKEGTDYPNIEPMIEDCNKNFGGI
eukprot:CAMPEP_0114597780 /NCGR_PEP_ID=MMETSP0125-20121206/20132_1 /TAXON_ID=485358 ORGANISM="Aristerostoma sp., Strain ATCC 50986" /NCGR_SAMPLE_ID=MMETSP0125 /ASSEMBLY_ACC=CAM_ASM_000245 /LENGTH=74 /DNA_ID=CAMNT_0001802817 /DNA_START=1259 /DNA_END=1483 /DNA_ORIENTATION=-